MHSERTRKAWQEKSEQIYREIAHLKGLEQSETFRERLEAIDDDDARAAIQLLVWYWVGHGKEERPKEWLTTNTILAGTFFVTFLIAWWELGAPIVWSAALALIATVLVRFVFRMLDRGFMFRRLFIACVSSGLLLIGPAQLKLEFETPFGTISWGGAPDGALVMIWVICTLLTFSGAAWEHFASNRT